MKESYFWNKAVEIAQSKIGMKEVGGANKGPIVAWAMKHFTKAEVGAWAEWCAAFVCTCLIEAGSLQAKKYGSTNVGTLWNNLQSKGLVWRVYNTSTQKKPQPGDIAFYEGLGHVGLVESFDGKMVTTIDGNNGDAVRRESHPVTHYHGFARFEI